ncbi:hypothetical protein [Actinomyces minihominis]|uniref:hypothetical protein n=1 Tax=Actinomyces minihominis TaxID=2002838 RepID=UPI00101AE4A7|nr:hypothetical protein [Actinomyces minihominis]
MGQVAIVIGFVLVIFTLIDTFFTVMNYNQRGVLVNPAIALEWRFIHWLVRPLNRRLRVGIYRALTGVILLSGIAIWVTGILLGFALIYFGAMQMGHLHAGPGSPGGFVGAMYFSIAQFATVGAIGMTPDATLVSILSVSETLISVLLLSLVITYLVNIFNAIEALRTLCACFPSRYDYVTAPLATLAPYLPREDKVSLETHLAATREAMNAYFDCIASDHSSIYFYSGKDRFSMPFAVFNIAGTLEGLKSGLPLNHPASKLPELERLLDSFESCRGQVYELFRWPEPEGAKPVDSDTFVARAEKAAALDGDLAVGPIPNAGFDHQAPLPARLEQNLNLKRQWEEDHTEMFESADQYISRFVKLRLVALRMSEIEPTNDWQNEYQAYVDWLSFAPVADDFIRRTSHLFDYNPTYNLGEDAANSPISLYGWQAEDPVPPAVAAQKAQSSSAKKS